MGRGRHRLRRRARARKRRSRIAARLPRRAPGALQAPQGVRLTRGAAARRLRQGSQRRAQGALSRGARQVSGVGSGLPLAHRIEGQGPPVVLLNGGMMTFASWEPIAARLRERYQALRFDFRGQLLSPGEPPAELAGHADDVAALLDRVGWPSAHCVGTSFGALVAVELAARAPGSVRSLLLATAMDRTTPALRSQCDAMRALLAEIAG